MKLGRTCCCCYYLAAAAAALSAITTAHAFSSLKKSVPRESSSLDSIISCGFNYYCPSRKQKHFATKKWEDVLSSDKRLDGTTANNSIFENIFRIQMWPNSGSPPPSSLPTDKSKSSTPTTDRLDAEKLVDCNATGSTSEIANDDNHYLPNEATIHSGEQSVKCRTNHPTLLHRSDNTSRLPKLGILLIDHGSKRKASNEHLHSIAQSYQTLWDSVIARSAHSEATFKVIVRAAHMEIAAPSIETQLRLLVTQHRVTHAICVPYFLSPGKHAIVDVPHLINEARNRLDEEGLLEYDDDGSRSKRALVEIHTTKSVGSNIESMLNVVDDLVRITLKEREGGSTFQLDSHNAGHRASKRNREQSNGNHTPDFATTNELQKYANRAALLENVLQVNTRQLKIMTNRAMLMETALEQLQIKWKKETKESREMKEKQEKIFAEQVANLTATMEKMTIEKDTMMKTLENKRFEMEREYNAKIGNLEAKVSLMDQELMRVVDENKHATIHVEEGKSCISEESEEKSRQQQERIEELQSQLTDLLDAYAQLEQLQNYTERAFHDKNEKLKELNETYWMDAQRQIEQDGARLHQLLNETESKYEVLLEEERGKALEWKGKWEAMNVEQCSPGKLESSRNSTYDQQIGPVATEQELYEATKFNADAIDRIQTLEAELSRQKKQYESTSVRKEEQQQQLQTYLRAQLSTYYETIQSQISQIAMYEEEIADMRQRHNESILIATSSVEASQRREERLLSNIEELESELLIVEKERESRKDELSALRARLHKIEDLQLHSEMLAKQNEELREKTEVMERKLIELTQQKDQALAKNKSIVLERIEKFEKDDLDKSSPNPQHKRFRWARAIFRPFALVRRKR